MLHTTLHSFIFLLAQAPLGIIPKCEKSNEGMIDTIEQIQEKYVPTITSNQQSGKETIFPEMTFMGGDELTEERGRNIQVARLDGDTQETRLEGVFPKNEDWHAIRMAYYVIFINVLQS